MATGDLAAVNTAGDVQAIMGLLNALRPAGGYTSTQTTGPQTVTTSDKTQTTEEVASPEAVQALVQSMLQGTNGLAAISGMQKTAGMYNSTTNGMLTNDLMSRIASAGAALNKKTVQTISGGTTTTSGQTQSVDKVMTPQITAAEAAKIAAAVAAASALKKALGGGKSAGPKGPPGGGGRDSSNGKKLDDLAEAYGGDGKNSVTDFGLGNNGALDGNFDYVGMTNSVQYQQDATDLGNVQLSAEDITNSGAGNDINLGGWQNVSVDDMNYDAPSDSGGLDMGFNTGFDVGFGGGSGVDNLDLNSGDVQINSGADDFMNDWFSSSNPDVSWSFDTAGWWSGNDNVTFDTYW